MFSSQQLSTRQLFFFFYKLNKSFYGLVFVVKKTSDNKTQHIVTNFSLETPTEGTLNSQMHQLVTINANQLVATPNHLTIDKILHSEYYIWNCIELNLDKLFRRFEFTENLLYVQRLFSKQLDQYIFQQLHHWCFYTLYKSFLSILAQIIACCCRYANEPFTYAYEHSHVRACVRTELLWLEVTHEKMTRFLVDTDEPRETLNTEDKY